MNPILMKLYRVGYKEIESEDQFCYMGVVIGTSYADMVAKVEKYYDGDDVEITDISLDSWTGDGLPPEGLIEVSELE